MAKVRKYKPLKDILSIDTTLVQASALLDIAAAKAIDEGDIAGMKKVAHAWLELGAVIHQLSSPEEEEIEEHEVVSRAEIGFRGEEELSEEEWEEPEFKMGFRG